MNRLPYKSDPMVVRTDFSNQRVWSYIKRSILGWRDEDYDARGCFEACRAAAEYHPRQCDTRPNRRPNGSPWLQ